MEYIQVPVTAKVSHLMWHGTKSKYLRSILKHGLSPVSGKTVDPTDSFIPTGNYLSADILTANFYTRGKDSGNPVLILCTISMDNESIGLEDDNFFEAFPDSYYPNFEKFLKDLYLGMYNLFGIPQEKTKHTVENDVKLKTKLKTYYNYLNTCFIVDENSNDYYNYKRINDRYNNLAKLVHELDLLADFGKRLAPFTQVKTPSGVGMSLVINAPITYKGSKRILGIWEKMLSYKAKYKICGEWVNKYGKQYNKEFIKACNDTGKVKAEEIDDKIIVKDK